MALAGSGVRPTPATGAAGAACGTGPGCLAKASPAARQATGITVIAYR
jgi:hypothetical protein